MAITNMTIIHSCRINSEVIKMYPLLAKLKHHIDEFEKKTKHIQWEKITNELHFDPQLFFEHHDIDSIQFYLDKIKTSYHILSESITNNDIVKTEYFSERLINQMTAFSRELSTNHLRSHSILPEKESLPEKYARHLDYLRRLNIMKTELQDDILNQHKITLIDSRIMRCKKAIKSIEEMLDK